MFLTIGSVVVPIWTSAVSLMIGIYLSEALSTQGQREIPLLEALITAFLEDTTGRPSVYPTGQSHEGHGPHPHQDHMRYLWNAQQ
mgnify:CR=1